MNKLEKCIKEHVLKNVDISEERLEKVVFGSKVYYLKKDRSVRSMSWIEPLEDPKDLCEEFVRSKLLNCIELYREETRFDQINIGFKEIELSSERGLVAYNAYKQFYDERIVYYIDLEMRCETLAEDIQEKKIQDKEFYLKNVEYYIELINGFKKLYTDLKVFLHKKKKGELSKRGRVKLEKEDVSWLEVELVCPCSVYSVKNILELYKGLIVGGIIEEKDYKIDGKSYKYIKLFIIRDKKSYKLDDGVDKLILSVKELESTLDKSEMLICLKSSKKIICDDRYYMRLNGEKVYIHTLNMLLNLMEKEELYMIFDIFHHVGALLEEYMELLEKHCV